MDVSILVSWRTKYQQVAWSTGYCAHCQELNAVRVENAIEVVSLWFVPVSKRVIGRVGRCDFCERPIEGVISTTDSQLDAFASSDHSETLVAELAPSGAFEPSENVSDIKLRSLLTATKEASSINNMDITFGTTTGILLGIAVGVPLGILLFESGIVRTQLDKIGFVVGAILAGVVAGAVVGATVHALFKRGKVASQKIQKACADYRLDTAKLEHLSCEYGGVVERAVREVHESSGRTRYDVRAADGQ